MKLSFHFLDKRGSMNFDLAADLHATITGVFGPSGSGKTTLLHFLAGTERPKAGFCSLDDRTLFDANTKTHIPPRLRQVGVVFQEGRLFPHLNVRDNLMFGYQLLAEEKRRFKPDDLIQLLELGPLMSRRPLRLSGGERQRVALGRAILASPQLLLLDEPLAALDRGLKQQILPFLRRIRDQLGLPMIHVSHDMSELLQLTDQLLMIDQGRILAQGSFLDLVRRQDVLELIHDPGLINVQKAKIGRVNPHEGIAELMPPGVQTPWIGPDREGAETYFSLRPEDIALVKKPVRDISIQNQIQGRIIELVVHHHKALCIVDVGTPLLVEITPRTVHSLDLKPGSAIFCLFKAQAVKYL